ncbi:MAG: ferrochelatase [Planctomycetales bacterium]|nr:ferrochelatase [Planctomycetales bacterium]
MANASAAYDSVILVSFGGPEGPDDVMPFLENVLRGKNVPRERLLEVAAHYRQFGGVSPINAQNRDLLAALRSELDAAGIDLPIYWGNRNWHPLLPDTLQQMRDEGRQRALAFFTSMFSSYSGCRQYREDIARAQQSVGQGAPQVDKVRMGFNHPLFIEAQRQLTAEALQTIAPQRRAMCRLLFTAHSIPLAMAEHCRYVEQLSETARLVATALGHTTWEVVYQSRSGPPHQPWLEPDICQRLEQLASSGTQDVAVIPLGFVSDHMEVLFDLDTEARETCVRLGLGFVRAPSVGTHPSFVRMVRSLLEERLLARPERPSLGELGASHDFCPLDCCLYPRGG